jgi:copper(I)-binding protein
MRKLAKYLIPLVALPAFAQTPVSVHDAWARATAPGQTTGAVYMSLTSPAGDTLTGISSPAAGAAMLHKTTQMNGMSGMTDMDTLPLPAGTKITLAPQGMHVMLMDLKHPLVAGQNVEVDLTFAKSPGIQVKAPVQPISAAAPPA